MLVAISKDMADLVPKYADQIKLQIGIKIAGKHRHVPLPRRCAWKKRARNRPALYVLIANNERSEVISDFVQRLFLKRNLAFGANLFPFRGG